MAVELKPGARFRSAVGDTEVVVIKAPADPVDLRCGGHPVVPIGDEPPAGLTAEAGIRRGHARSASATSTAPTSSSCSARRAGSASLSVGTELLVLKDAKPLPSSD